MSVLHTLHPKRILLSFQVIFKFAFKLHIKTPFNILCDNMFYQSPDKSFFISRGVSLEEGDSKGWTPLIIACITGRADNVKVILNHFKGKCLITSTFSESLLSIILVVTIFLSWSRKCYNQNGLCINREGRRDGRCKP